MSMLSEQIKELRTIANNLSIGHNMPISLAIERFRQAADTIESLSAKLQAENMENGCGWVACDDRLPENSKNKGSFCPKYYVMTKYGKTIGWYNPDYNSWFVLIWFMTERYLTEEIDMERGDIPKIVRAPLECGIVTAWKSFDEPYRT